MNNWKFIWEKREVSNANFDLQSLINLDGFDSGAGKISAKSWLAYVSWISSALDISPDHSVYEVGCGAGPFLYALKELHGVTSVGGLDYSSALISVAKEVMPGGNFEVLDAIKMHPGRKYDFVIANSVFHYFDISVAESVFKLMLKKSNLGVVVLDLPNLDFKKKSEELRRGLVGEKEYEKKYIGLNHSYYSKDWFINLADKAKVQILDQNIEGYEQSPFRFNVILIK